MRKFINIKLVKTALGLCVALMLAFSVALCCSAACLNVVRFNRRNAATEDVPPIGEGLESAIDGIGTGAGDIIDGIESGADNIIDGIESGAGDIADGAESFFDGTDGNMEGVTDGVDDMTDGMDGFETNIPDPDIGGAVVDNDKDGLSNPTDSDDDNDGTPDVSDTDADNDGISDMTDPDPDGDGVNESKRSGLVVGIIIAILVIGAIAVLAYVFMPKKDSGNKR